MPEDINIEEIMQIFENQQQSQNPEDFLEQHLLNLILNPVKANRQRIKIDDRLGDGIVFELREGTIINEHGIQEDIEELIINPETFADGASVNLYGVVKCPKCNSIVKEESLRICCFCGSYICTIKGCGFYSFLNGKWFCSIKHRILGIVKKLY